MGNLEGFSFALECSIPVDTGFLADVAALLRRILFTKHPILVLWDWTSLPMRSDFGFFFPWRWFAAFRTSPCRSFL